MASGLNIGATLVTCQDEKSAFENNSTKHWVIIKNREWWKTSSNFPRLCEVKVVLSRLGVADMVPLPGRVGYSVEPLSAAINPLNKDQIPGIGNYPARKAKRNAVASGISASCCLGCVSNRPCKQAKSSACVTNASKKRKYVKKNRAAVGRTYQVGAESHLSDALVSTCRTAENPVSSTSLSVRKDLSAEGSAGVVFPDQDTCPVVVHSTNQVPLYDSGSLGAHCASSSSKTTPEQESNHCVYSPPSAPSLLSLTSQEQVCLNADNITGCLENRTQAAVSSRQEVPVVSSCVSSTACNAVVTLGNSLTFAINTVATPCAAPSPLISLVNPVLTCHTGVRHSPQSLLPPTLPASHHFATQSIIPFHQTSGQVQPGNRHPFGSCNVTIRPPIYPLMRYSPFPFVINSRQDRTDGPLLNTFNLNLSATNTQSSSFERHAHLGKNYGTSGICANNSTCSTSAGYQKDGDGRTIASIGHQTDHVTSRYGHQRGNVGTSLTSVTYQNHLVGLGSTNNCHQRNHVGFQTNSTEGRSASVNMRGGNTVYEGGHGSEVSEEATFSLSSLLPDLPNEEISVTTGSSSQSFLAQSNGRLVANAACSKLERILTMVAKRDLTDYQWLLHCWRNSNTTEDISKVTGLKKFIANAELKLKVENFKLQKECVKVNHNISMYQGKLNCDTRRYKKALNRTCDTQRTDKDLKRKEAELEEMKSEVKVLIADMEELQLKWLHKDGTVRIDNKQSQVNSKSTL